MYTDQCVRVLVLVTYTDDGVMRRFVCMGVKEGITFLGC